MRRNQAVDVTIITGLSGAGRSEAAKALEDLGWFVIDNLPPALIDKMLGLALGSAEPIRQIALVIDARGGTFFEEANEALSKVRRDASSFRVVFLEASDDVLVRRFEASRRRHPLADEGRVIMGIQREKELMKALREGADLILDTSDLSVRDLRTRLGSYFEADSAGDLLTTTVLSFGYKHGLPLDSDIVLDVRFLPNPHWVPELRDSSGLEDEVRDYVMDQEATADFIDRIRDLFATLLPGFHNEGRHYLTIAVGCTGGRHRSVVLAEVIAELIREKGFPARVIHRDIDRTTIAS